MTPTNQQPPARSARPPTRPRLDAVVAELTAGERLGVAVMAGKLAAGVPLSLLGPFVVSLFLYALQYRFFGDAVLGFLLTFLLACALVLPLLMSYERRTKGQHLADSLDGADDPYEASSYGEYRLAEAHVKTAGLIEVALTGPRLLWEVADEWAGRSSVDPAERELAAGLALDLLAAGEGRHVRELIRPDRPPAALSRVVRYLLARDWVGVSAAGDRVWLLTSTRERLVVVLRAVG